MPPLTHMYCVRPSYPLRYIWWRIEVSKVQSVRSVGFIIETLLVLNLSHVCRPGEETRNTGHGVILTLLLWPGSPASALSWTKLGGDRFLETTFGHLVNHQPTFSGETRLIFYNNNNIDYCQQLPIIKNMIYYLI